jgi:hypothetical protein
MCAVGDGGNVRWNYQLMRWYIDHWNDGVTKKGVFHYYRNQHAVNICFGLLVPMLFLQFLKKQVFKPTPERKRMIWFKIWTIFVNIMPLIAILIGGPCCAMCTCVCMHAFLCMHA